MADKRQGGESLDRSMGPLGREVPPPHPSTQTVEDLGVHEMRSVQDRFGPDLGFDRGCGGPA
jgi:hypothetical protein